VRAHVESDNWLNGSAVIWLQWTVGSIVGCALGCAAGIWFGSGLLVLLGVGLGEGGVHAAILGRYVHTRAWRWLLVAAIAWPISIVAGFVGGLIWLGVFGRDLTLAFGRWSPSPWPGALEISVIEILRWLLWFAPGGGIAGIVFGALQWPSVRQSGAAKCSWLAAHGISGLLLAIVFFALLNALKSGNAANVLTLAAFGGAIYGAISGFPLSKMLAAKRAVAPEGKHDCSSCGKDLPQDSLEPLQ
jgi:hypothetical protein